MTSLRAALYVRVSSRDRQTVENQLVPLRAEATRRDWEVVGVYRDEVTGSSRSRPGLDQLLRHVAEGRVDVVAVWRFDRWARSTSHLIESLELLRRQDVEFVSLTESVDTTTGLGRFFFTLLAAVGELERDILAERVRAGLDRARAEGVRLGRPPVHVDTVAARMLLREGKSLRNVAKSLNISRRVLTRRLKESTDA
jgi:putative DNA-invertase from lambdoid prophage Rac